MGLILSFSIDLGCRRHDSAALQRACDNNVIGNRSIESFVDFLSRQNPFVDYAKVIDR